jgi:hypothetical protein
MVGKQRVMSVVSIFNRRRLLRPRKIFQSDNGSEPLCEAFSVVVCAIMDRRLRWAESLPVKEKYISGKVLEYVHVSGS